MSADRAFAEIAALPSDPWLAPVQVWKGNLGAIPLAIEGMALELTAEERARAAAFRFERDRERFIRRRWLRLHLIAAAQGVAMKSIRVEHDALGRPNLVAPRELIGLQISTSSAGDVALVALSTGPRVGIDVAAVDAGLADEGAAVVFMSPVERDSWRAERESERAAGFFRLWTRKEAALKALGTGLQRDPRTVTVLDDNASGAGLGAGEDGPLRLFTLELSPGLAGALAVVAAR